MFGCFGEADEVTAYPARLRNKGAAPKQSSHPGGFEPKRVCRGLGQKHWVPDFRLYCTGPMAQVYITITIFAVLNVVTGVFWALDCSCDYGVGRSGIRARLFLAALGATELRWSGEYVPICFQHACESLFVNMFWDHRATCALNGVFNGRHSVRSRYHGREVTLPSKAPVQTRTSCANKLTAVPFLVY